MSLVDAETLAALREQLEKDRHYAYIPRHREVAQGWLDVLDTLAGAEERLALVEEAHGSALIDVADAKAETQRLRDGIEAHVRDLDVAGIPTWFLSSLRRLLDGAR